jgi:hypothetical protein
MVKPYLGIKNDVLKDMSVKEGVNFAVMGATALDISFFEERGVHSVTTNYSVGVQLNWFKELLPRLCNSSKSKFSIILLLCFFITLISWNCFASFER